MSNQEQQINVTTELAASAVALNFTIATRCILLEPAVALQLSRVIREHALKLLEMPEREADESKDHIEDRL